MNNVYIKSEFKDELKSLCGVDQDYISIYRTEGDKMFFSYGSCKLHITKKELDRVRAETD